MCHFEIWIALVSTVEKFTPNLYRHCILLLGTAAISTSTLSRKRDIPQIIVADILPQIRRSGLRGGDCGSGDAMRSAGGMQALKLPGAQSHR